jgi:nitrogen fixation NifU-like protein
MPFDVDKFAEELQEEIMRDARQRYSKAVIEHWMKPLNFARMDTCDGYGRVTGSCGDTMEVFLRVREKTVSEAAFFTDGCGTTIACGSMVVFLATGKSLDEAEKIDKETLLEALGGLPPEDEHCAEITANALRYALIDYETGSMSKKGKEV